MDSYIIVLFYSKFSNACTKFIKDLDSCPELKENTVMVCVDNKEIREKITSEGTLKINKVPCIMRIYDETGYVESFEGEKAFDLIKLYVSDINNEKYETFPIHSVQSSKQSDYLAPVQVDNSKISFPPRTDEKPRQFTSIEAIENGRSQLDESGVVVGTYTHIPRSSEDPQIFAEREIQDKMMKSHSSPPQNLVSKALLMQKEREQSVQSKN